MYAWGVINTPICAPSTTGLGAGDHHIHPSSGPRALVVDWFSHQIHRTCKSYGGIFCCRAKFTGGFNFVVCSIWMGQPDINRVCVRETRGIFSGHHDFVTTFIIVYPCSYWLGTRMNSQIYLHGPVHFLFSPTFTSFAPFLHFFFYYTICYWHIFFLKKHILTQWSPFSRRSSQTSSPSTGTTGSCESSWARCFWAAASEALRSSKARASSMETPRGGCPRRSLGWDDVGWVATGIHWFIMFHSKIWPFGSIVWIHLRGVAAHFWCTTGVRTVANLPGLQVCQALWLRRECGDFASVFRWWENPWK